MSGLFKGDKEFQGATKEIDRAINTFTVAIVDLGNIVGIELVKQTNKIQNCVEDLFLRFGGFVDNFENHLRNIENGVIRDTIVVVGEDESLNPLAAPFYGVPYDRNSEFVGREKLLTSLFDTLNHNLECYTKRVSLFGLGGVGDMKHIVQDCIVVEQ